MHRKKLVAVATAFIALGSIATATAQEPLQSGANDSGYDPTADTSWVTSNHPTIGSDDPNNAIGTKGSISPMGVIYGDGPCHLMVWEVSQNPSVPWLGVRGGREGCTNYGEFTVELRKQVRHRPDKVLGTARDGGNTTTVASAPCDGPATYFGRVVSQYGNVIQGERNYLCQ